MLNADNREGVYFLVEDEEARTLIEGAAGTLRFAFMLKPDETKELIIKSKFKDGVPLEVMSRFVMFRIWWRRGNATWLPQMPVVVRSTTSVIRQLGGVQ